MALVRCPDCGRDISSEAPACPSCGRPMKIEPPVAFTPPVVSPVAPPPKEMSYNRPPAIGQNPRTTGLLAAIEDGVAGLAGQSWPRWKIVLVVVGVGVVVSTIFCETARRSAATVREAPKVRTPSPEEVKIIEQNQRGIDKQLEAIKTNRLSGGERRQAAEIWQAELLKQGMDAYVFTSGKNATTITLKYILVNRPLAHNLGPLMENRFRALGFTKFYMTNGLEYNHEGWTFDYSPPDEKVPQNSSSIKRKHPKGT